VNNESEIQGQVEAICRIAEDAIRAGHEVELTIGTKVVYRYNSASAEQAVIEREMAEAEHEMNEAGKDGDCAS
jgi:hypothetical protein